jgi:hypothetical protein
VPDGLELHLAFKLDRGLHSGDGVGIMRWLLDLVGDLGPPRWLDEARAHLGRESARSGKPGLGSGSVTRQPDTRKRGNRLAGRRRFLAAGHLCALAVWVYRQRGGAPRLNRGKGGRMQAASGKGLCGRSTRLAGRVRRDGE